MAAQRVDQLGPLPHKALVRPKGDGTPLFLSALHCNEPHAGTAGRFGYRLGVGEKRAKVGDALRDGISWRCLTGR